MNSTMKSILEVIASLQSVAVKADAERVQDTLRRQGIERKTSTITNYMYSLARQGYLVKRESLGSYVLTTMGEDTIAVAEEKDPLLGQTITFDYVRKDGENKFYSVVVDDVNDTYLGGITDHGYRRFIMENISNLRSIG